MSRLGLLIAISLPGCFQPASKPPWREKLDKGEIIKLGTSYERAPEANPTIEKKPVDKKTKLEEPPPPIIMLPEAEKKIEQLDWDKLKEKETRPKEKDDKSK